MNAQQINRASSTALVGLSVVALLAVVSGYFQAPHADEGSAAHIFQLAIALLIPTNVAFLASADWKQPWRGARPLAISAVIVVTAFSALYYLEHYFYLHR